MEQNQNVAQDGDVEKTNAAQLETETAEKEQSAKKGKVSSALANYFTATRIAYIAVFTALAYILYLPVFQFSLFPAVEFLKIDFSNVFALIAGFSLGPVAGAVVCILKEIIHALTLSQTVGIGELANIIITLPYILIPSIIYKKHKGIKVVILTLLLGCAAQTLVSIPVNYWLNFPFFFGFNWKAGMSFYLSVWQWVTLFNLIKTLLISAGVLVIYKPLSNLIKATNKKFMSVKAKRSKA